MTWEEFKEKVEEKGVTDEMEVLYIDVDDPVNVFVKFTPDRTQFSVDYC